MAYGNPTISYQQTDVTGVRPLTVCYTQGDIRTMGRRNAKEGATAGTAAIPLSHDTGGLTVACMIQWWIDPGPGVDWNEGSWSVPVEVSVAQTNLKFSSISFCHMRKVSGKWQSQANMGEKVLTSGPTLTLGVHTLAATGMAGVANPLSGDQVLIAVKILNQIIISPVAVTLKSSQLIKTPFNGQKRAHLGNGAPNRKRNVLIGA